MMLSSRALWLMPLLLAAIPRPVSGTADLAVEQPLAPVSGTITLTGVGPAFVTDARKHALCAAFAHNLGNGVTTRDLKFTVGGAEGAAVVSYTVAAASEAQAAAVAAKARRGDFGAGLQAEVAADVTFAGAPAGLAVAVAVEQPLAPVLAPAATVANEDSDAVSLRNVLVAAAVVVFLAVAVAACYISGRGAAGTDVDSLVAAKLEKAIDRNRLRSGLSQPRSLGSLVRPMRTSARKPRQGQSVLIPFKHIRVGEKLSAGAGGQVFVGPWASLHLRGLATDRAMRNCGGLAGRALARRVRKRALQSLPGISSCDHADLATPRRPVLRPRCCSQAALCHQDIAMRRRVSDGFRRGSSHAVAAQTPWRVATLPRAVSGLGRAWQSEPHAIQSAGSQAPRCLQAAAARARCVERARCIATPNLELSAPPLIPRPSSPSTDAHTHAHAHAHARTRCACTPSPHAAHQASCSSMECATTSSRCTL